MKGRELIHECVDLVVEQRFEIPGGWSQMDRVAALAGKILPDQKPDFDNIAALCSNAFNGIVWDDDERVTRHSIKKVFAEKPGLTIVIQTIPTLLRPSRRKRFPRLTSFTRDLF
jgi:Holliday junction resolvase RusA-like endonuclease